MTNDMKAILELMDISTEKMKNTDPQMQIAFLATLFDHICEKNHLNKAETLETMIDVIKNVNANLGNMY